MQERDFVGYGRNPPDPKWPNGARLALNFNLNFEGGGERSMLEGDGVSEDVLNDMGQPALQGLRSPLVESVFEYGSRIGVWRLLDLFAAHRIKISVLAVARALECCPDAARAFVEQGHEIVSHGYRWLDYQLVDEATERQHIAQAIDTIRRITGASPSGWMTGRPSQNTRRLLVEHGSIEYDRDAINDELPYWVFLGDRSHLVIPYSFETNDNRFDQNNGFSTAGQYAEYMIDCFDVMYREGAHHPKLMSVALHDRLIGRPARSHGLALFLAHVARHTDVWICTGADIAAHWHQHFPRPLAPAARKP
jgi:peptidoglycan/xylan/chitin deacetylase (PgdA/CDA1 family)